MTTLPSPVKPLTRIASVLGIVQSLVWIILTSIGLSSYNYCQYTKETFTNSELLIVTIHRYYFLNDGCSEYRSLSDTILDSYQIYIWCSVNLAVSCLWFIVSVCLSYYVSEENINNINISIYCWSIVALGVTGIDLALGILFGVDYDRLSQLLDNYGLNPVLESVHELEVLRFGVLMLMMVAVRGCLLAAINLLIAAVLFYYTFEINKHLNNSDHNIHNMGPLYAYGKGVQNRGFNKDESWNQQTHGPSQFDRDDERSLSKIDFRSFDRSTSWHQNKNIPEPFSYLAEPGQKSPNLDVISSANRNRESQMVQSRWDALDSKKYGSKETSKWSGLENSRWSSQENNKWNGQDNRRWNQDNRRWDGPSLPAPDYSPPPHHRNLKPVLKPTH